MPRLLTRGNTPARWTASVRNGGRHHLGNPAGFTSESPAGLIRNLHARPCCARVHSVWQDDYALIRGAGVTSDAASTDTNA